VWSVEDFEVKMYDILSLSVSVFRRYCCLNSSKSLASFL
jgi:hypothetical protein